MTTQIEYVPSPEDIAAATAAIRGRWSVDEVIRRRRVRPQRSVPTEGVKEEAVEALRVKKVYNRYNH